MDDRPTRAELVREAVANHEPLSPRDRALARRLGLEEEMRQTTCPPGHVLMTCRCGKNQTAIPEAKTMLGPPELYCCLQPRTYRRQQAKQRGCPACLFNEGGECVEVGAPQVRPDGCPKTMAEEAVFGQAEVADLVRAETVDGEQAPGEVA